METTERHVNTQNGINMLIGLLAELAQSEGTHYRTQALLAFTQLHILMGGSMKELEDGFYAMMESLTPKKPTTEP